MQSLFKPGAKINQDHKHKYIHILAYAASVVETWKKVLSVLRAHGNIFTIVYKIVRAQCLQELCGVSYVQTSLAHPISSL